MWEIILKGLPVFGGLLLTFLFSFVLGKRTSKLACDELLIIRDDLEKLDTLKYLLNWRDLITAVLTGLFVLQFSAAQKIASNNSVLATIASVVTVAIIPLMIISIWLLADYLEPHHVQSKGVFWSVITLITLCYVFSLVFTYI